MGQTKVLVPVEAQLGDGEKSQAAAMDDHFAKSVTPKCRATVQRWSRGNGCEDRVADERDVLDTQVLATLQELERMSRAGLLAHLITLYLQEVAGRRGGHPHYYRAPGTDGPPHGRRDQPDLVR